MLLIILIARSPFRTTLSVLIIGAMVGLGFQVMENLSYTVKAAVSYPLQRQLAPVLLNLLTRGFMSGLWSHAAYTAIASFGVAWALLHPHRRMRARTWPAVLWFLIAWSLHFIWNSPLLEDAFGNGYGDLALLLAIKGLPALLAAALIWRVATQENGTWLHTLAATLVPERDLIADDEWLTLGAPLKRYAARRSMGWQHGLQARRLLARLQREQLRLVRKAATYGRGKQTRRHEMAVRRLRSELAKLEA